MEYIPALNDRFSGKRCAQAGANAFIIKQQNRLTSTCSAVYHDIFTAATFVMPWGERESRQRQVCSVFAITKSSVPVKSQMVPRR